MRAVLLSDVAYMAHIRQSGRPFCPQEKILLRHMIDCGRISMESAIGLLWGGHEDGGPLGAANQVITLMHYIRRRLRPGWALTNHHRKEWHLVQQTEMDLAA